MEAGVCDGSAIFAVAERHVARRATLLVRDDAGTSDRIPTAASACAALAHDARRRLRDGGIHATALLRPGRELDIGAAKSSISDGQNPPARQRTTAASAAADRAATHHAARCKADDAATNCATSDGAG